MTDDHRNKIIHIKEQIDDLTEYLHSDICRSCGEIALKLEGYIKELSSLLNHNDTNS